jgi:chromosome partitioning protein
LQTIAVINQKGGVGKTTTTVNLGAGLALCGKRVLLVDLDPQANLTSHLEWEPFNLALSTYDLLRGKVGLHEVMRPANIPNLYLAPSNGDLAAAEIELATEIGRESILKDKLKKADEASSSFDYVLIDCPPSLGLLAVNALTAADEALVPIQAEFFALQGMARFVEVQNLVQERLNPALRLGGIVICMWRGQANLSREVRDEVQKVFGDVLFDTVVRQNVKLAEAPSSGRTIYEHAPDSNGAADYAALALEFLRRHGETVTAPNARFAVPRAAPRGTESHESMHEPVEDFDAAPAEAPPAAVPAVATTLEQLNEAADAAVDSVVEDAPAPPSAWVEGAVIFESTGADPHGAAGRTAWRKAPEAPFRPIHVRPFGDVRLVGEAAAPDAAAAADAAAADARDLDDATDEEDS